MYRCILVRGTGVRTCFSRVSKRLLLEPTRNLFEEEDFGIERLFAIAI